MRARIKVAETIKNHIYYFFIIFIVILIIFYLSVWNMFSSKIKKLLKTSNARYEISFDSLKTNGFIFFNTKIKNFKLRSLVKEKNFEVEFGDINIKNIIFLKDFFVLIKNNGEIKVDESKFEILLPNDLNIQLSLIKGDLIRSIIINGTKILINDIENQTSLEMQNLILERYTVYPNGDNTINTAIRVNIDKLLAREKEKNGNTIEYENNFECVFSIINDINDKKEILTEKIEIEKFAFNDVNNNFGIEVIGEYNTRISTRLSTMDAVFKIVNYNSLIKSINNNKFFLLVETKNLSNFVEFLYFVPKNSRDTIYNKYYNLKFESSSKSLKLNGEEINNIIKKTLFNKK